MNVEWREKHKAKVKQYQEANPEKRKAQHLKKHGITLEEFRKLMEQQEGKCAICGYADLADKRFFPVVDHCHKTMQIRGLLCMNCNQGLGKFKDDPGLLMAAIRYLLKSRG
jgi:hypothetical protein